MITVKTYQSNTYGSFGLTLEQSNGNSIYISFGGGSRYLNQCSVFTTSDKNIQELLEGSSYYGRYYKLLKTQEIMEREDIKREESRYQKVFLKNNNAARSWFKENLPDVAVSYLRTQQDFQDKAKEYGYIITFENAKTEE